MVIKDLKEVDPQFQKNAEIPRREPPDLTEVDGEGRPLKQELTDAQKMKITQQMGGVLDRLGFPGDQSPRGVIPSPPRTPPGGRPQAPPSGARRVHPADLMPEPPPSRPHSAGSGRSAVRPARAAPQRPQSAQSARVAYTMEDERRAGPHRPAPPPPEGHWMEHPGTPPRPQHPPWKGGGGKAGSVELGRSSAPRARRYTSTPSENGSRSAAEDLLDHLEMTGVEFPDQRSKDIVASFLHGQQSAYEGQIEHMNKQVARRCYPRPWAKNMKTNQTAPKHRRAPVRHPNNRQSTAWTNEGAPIAPPNGGAPPPYQKFTSSNRWVTVYGQSYLPPPASAYRKHTEGQEIKNSDSAVRYAEMVRLAKMNVALTKLTPGEVANALAEQSQYSDLFFLRPEKYGHLLQESQYCILDKEKMMYKLKPQKPGDTRPQWRVAW